jgi:hypothetical protein
VLCICFTITTTVTMDIHFKNDRSRQKHKSGSIKQHQDYHIRLIEYFSSGDDLDGGREPAAGGAGGRACAGGRTSRRRRRARPGRGRSRSDGLGRTERATGRRSLPPGGDRRRSASSPGGGRRRSTSSPGRGRSRSASSPCGVGRASSPGGVGAGAGEIRSERAKCVVCAAVWGAGRAGAQGRFLPSSCLADGN